MPPAILTVEVSRTIAQPADLVRRQFLDIAHHIRRGVHPGITFTLHSQNETETRYQLAQSVLGWRLVDEYRSSLTSAGTVLGEVLSGSHAGMCTEIFFEALTEVTDIEKSDSLSYFCHIVIRSLEKPAGHFHSCL